MHDAEATGNAASKRLRILFFAEAVTLAHVARPVALAKTLDPNRYDVCLAVDSRFHAVLGNLPFSVRQIHSISSRQFLKALDDGNPLYDAETLSGYVNEDLSTIAEFRPDVVVGDFRLSLAVSAREAGVRYVAISNAYWSPYAEALFPTPDLALSRRIGLPVTRFFFNVLRPVGFALHSRPLNVTRKRYGQKSLGRDIRRGYTEADEVMYADVPELIPTFDLPTTHHYIGPVLWSPSVALPDWWDSLPPDRPLVYVTLGTSGEIEVLNTILRALADMPISVMVATAGRVTPDKVPANAFVADYLPGVEASARSRLIISNGGSPTNYQALAAGIPVLGIPTNMDQHINMHYLQRAGAGVSLRTGYVTETTVKASVDNLLDDARYTQAADDMRAIIDRYHAPTRFQSVLLGKPAERVPHAVEGVASPQ